MARHLFLLSLLCLLFVSGCARPLAITVDSLGAPGQDLCYIILPGMDNVRADDLFFIEYKGRLAQMLASMDYQVAENEAEATAVVLLSWRTEEEAAAYYYDNGPRVGIGMGNGGYSRWGAGSFFGLGVGFPVGNGPDPSPKYRYQIILDALSSSADAKTKSLWKVVLTAKDNENNLRAAFPLMLEAARPYIGSDTHGSITVSIPKK